MNKEERLEVINSLITYISERGRRFFNRKEYGNDYMLLKNGRVYFHDAYMKKDLYAYHGSKSHEHFSHGGTLWALVCEFSDFIRDGKKANGKWGYGGLYSGGWGHSDEIQQEIIDYAKEIGYL